MVKIVQKENKVLREKAAPVPVRGINSPKIKKVLLEMSAALAKESDGVAIAAPQIGVSLRIFVVSGKVFSTPNDMVFINPEIIKISKDKKYMPEGCLSVRWLYGKVRRASKATVRAYDGQGKVFTRGGSGILAQIFQHEIDHLNGILFIDSAKDIEEMRPASPAGGLENNVK
jgi:peptide deformylase